MQIYLFLGDEFTTLMTQCKEGAQRDGLMLDSSDELYKWFTQQVIIFFKFNYLPKLWIKKIFEPTGHEKFACGLYHESVLRRPQRPCSDITSLIQSVSPKFWIPHLQALYLKFIFRCVLNWFGDWSNSALYQVAHEFTIKVDLERADWTKPDFFPVAVQGMFF